MKKVQQELDFLLRVAKNRNLPILQCSCGIQIKGDCSIMMLQSLSSQKQLDMALMMY
ncbi:hypothetical protein NE619_01320 [Anaerovorax odorimutans]|uniref:Uncharacterized protein n=1 Tax=Anaerovorax odorimutans TaxID=109327 RepID=A0ABT1RJK8_9FIRM|nr:hypothetical protein [Anaerovorax odorimutans]